MCGRTACTLNPDVVSKSCSYRRRDGQKTTPAWVKNEGKYYPSHNKAPQSYCPILLRGSHFQSGDEKLEFHPKEDDRVIAGMRWGLIPSWFKGEDVAKVSYNMNNARSDTLLEKRSYKNPLRKGQRCVVCVEGFYEWNTTPAGKQPYYIYFQDDSSCGGSKSNIKFRSNSLFATKLSPTRLLHCARVTKYACDDVDDCENIENESPRRLLTMAGIFEKTFHDGDDLYSFTVITVDAHSSFSWLHHRMPAILVGDEEVETWLDCEHVPLQKALELIKPKDCLRWHPVSKYVSNSRNHGPECWNEIDPTVVEKVSKPKFTAESKSMMKWLSSAPKKNPSSEQSSTLKKHKAQGNPMDKFVKKIKKD